MVRAKRPDSQTGLNMPGQKLPYQLNRESKDWNRSNGRNASGWYRKKNRLKGNWLRDQSAESGETYDKELASMERMKRGYFKK